MVPRAESHFFGLTDYSRALAVQEAFCERVRDGGCDRVLGFEHPAVVTLGIRGDTAQDLNSGAVATDFPVVHVRRGGQATLHNEGQLVVYPIVDLRRRGWGVRQYLEALQEAVRTTLLGYGIVTKTGAEPGLYLDGQKLAFFGVEVRRGVTMHGVSINVANDLRPFRGIRSCGVSNQAVTSLQEMGIETTTEEVFRQVSTNLLYLLTPHRIPSNLARV